MKIGDKIRYLRVDAGYTQKELSEKLGIKQNTLSDYERNVTAVSLIIVDKLSSIFDIEKSYFVDDTETNFMNNKLIVADMLDYLIEKGVITDPDNIDKSTIDMLVAAMKKDIEDKLKKQR